MITLKPVRESEFDCLREAFALRLSESNMSEFGGVDDLLVKLRQGYARQCLGAYVDNVEKPQHVLVMGHFPGFLTQGSFASIILVYSIPEARGDTSAVDVMIATAENYARLNGAEYLLGTSWVYRGSADIDALWKFYDFEPRERVFIKNLT